ncbi:hypothetical protein BJ928_105350 [Rhizobium sp. WW_1]|jgi:hypothetical protein|nr:hypothetical protein BJ928_105350 [Rhizobium sp. WW_1]
MVSAVLQVEFSQKVVQRGNLLGEAIACGGGFLDHGGVLLRPLVDAVDGRVDLLQAGRLFAGTGTSSEMDGTWALCVC